MIYDLQKGEKLESILAQHQGATILVFYANWCGPCKEVKPFIQKRAVEQAENQNEKFPRVIRINLDHHHEIADAYSVFSIPCLVLIKNGRPIQYLNSSDRTHISELFFKAEVIGFS